MYGVALARPEATRVKVRDPVCGMTIDAERAAAKGTYDGTTVYFCAVACQRRFERERASGGSKPH